MSVLDMLLFTALGAYMVSVIIAALGTYIALSDVSFRDDTLMELLGAFVAVFVALATAPYTILCWIRNIEVKGL